MVYHFALTEVAMTKLDIIERAEAFARKALINDLNQNVSDATIRAVALKIAKAVGMQKLEKQQSRQSAEVTGEQAEA
jgi:hypothetical protein